MSIQEMIDVKTCLSPLTPVKARDTLVRFVQGPHAIAPKKAAELIKRVCVETIGINGTQFDAVCVKLCAQLDPRPVIDFLSVPPIRNFDHPETWDSKVAYGIVSRLCMTENAAGNLDHSDFFALIAWWRVGGAGAGAGKLTLIQMGTLIDRLRPSPATMATGALASVLTGREIKLMTERYVLRGEGYPMHMHALVTHLANSRVGAKQMHDILIAMFPAENPNIRRASWLAQVLERSLYGGTQFGVQLKLAIDALVSSSDIGKALDKMFTRNIPEKDAGFLLFILSKVTGSKAVRFGRFLDEIPMVSGGNISLDVIAPLTSFVRFGRAPFGPGAAGGTFPLGLLPLDAAPVAHAATPVAPVPTNNGSRLAWHENVNGRTVNLYEKDVRHALNGHTYAHCDFQERIDRIVPKIDFWGVQMTQQAVVDLIVALGPAGLAVVLSSRPKQGVYHEGTIESLNIGIDASKPAVRAGLRITEPAITHISPRTSSTHQVKTSVLKAISHLFDSAPVVLPG